MAFALLSRADKAIRGTNANLRSLMIFNILETVSQNVAMPLPKMRVAPRRLDHGKRRIAERHFCEGAGEEHQPRTAQLTSEG